MRRSQWQNLTRKLQPALQQLMMQAPLGNPTRQAKVRWHSPTDKINKARNNYAVSYQTSNTKNNFIQRYLAFQWTNTCWYIGYICNNDFKRGHGLERKIGGTGGAGVVRRRGGNDVRSIKISKKLKLLINKKSTCYWHSLYKAIGVKA